MNEREAMVRLRDGDIAGLEPLVDQYYLQAVRAAYLVLRDRRLAEDVVQDAFIRVFEKAHGFDFGRPFAPWFFRIVVNDAVKTAKRERRQLSLDEQGDEGIPISELLPDVSDGPPELAERAEVHRAVWQAIGRLSIDQRSAIVLHYFLGLKQISISDRIGVPLGTVKRRLHDARNRLRTLLEGSEN